MHVANPMFRLSAARQKCSSSEVSLSVLLSSWSPEAMLTRLSR